MSDVNDLHNRAMELAERAIIARVQHDSSAAIELFRAAMEYELSAIEELDEKIEPTYSILHRSAATLALDCNEVSKAGEIANEALRSETPPEIAIELGDVLRQVEQRPVRDDNMKMPEFADRMDYELCSIEELEGRIEPTYSVFHRGAATLYLDSNESMFADPQIVIMNPFDLVENDSIMFRVEKLDRVIQSIYSRRSELFAR